MARKIICDICDNDMTYDSKGMKLVKDYDRGIKQDNISDICNVCITKLISMRKGEGDNK